MLISSAAVKTVVKKGKAPVDSECPQADSLHVYCEGDDIYDCMTNQVCCAFTTTRIARLRIVALQHPDTSDEPPEQQQQVLLDAAAAERLQQDFCRVVSLGSRRKERTEQFDRVWK